MPNTRTCGDCAADNPADAQFCMKCGTRLEQRCPACGLPATPDARFCIACGSEIKPDRGQPDALAPETGAGAPGTHKADIRARALGPEPTREERRTVTVLFADLSGYTAVSERLDPEAVKALVDRCMGRLGEEVERVGGRVDKYMGDNVMAIFGAPVAHEDDPERAVRAAVGMQAAMGELNQRLLADYGVEFALRVGVNTGEVLAGKVGDAYTVIGDAVNVASRLQTSASPGTITVGERTQRATSGVRRISAARTARAEGQGRAGGSLARARPIGASAPAAHAERAARRRWSAVTTSSPRCRCCSHGSSAMGAPSGDRFRPGRRRQDAAAARARALARSARDPPVRVRRGRCLPFGSSVVYWPLSEMLRAECAIVDGDPSEVAWAKLSTRLGPLAGDG